MTASIVFAAGLATQAAAAEKLNYYCSAQEDWCQLMARGFEEETGIKVNMTRRSSGETFALIKAESSNPKGDVWWGGTGDPHLQAAEEGLTQPYVTPMRGELHSWAISQAKSAGDKTIGIYSGALGYGYNEEILKANNLPVPACWKDLLKPEYKGHVQMANPNSSGTAYTTLATIVQLFGEEDGFEFMKALHKNINQYTKSGSAPIKAAARGENTIGIVFMHDGGALRGHRLRDRLDVDHRWGAQSGERQEVLRLGADRACAVALAGGEGLSGDVEPDGRKLARGAGSLHDQADRLRLQEVRLVGRAPPAVEEVGRRGKRPAAVSGAAESRARRWTAQSAYGY
jgi:spermidine/putrescine-binding protein